MKKLLLACTVLFLSIVSYGQTTDDYLEVSRSVLKTEKKAAISEVMELTEAESEVFWNLYNEYNDKLYVIQNKRISAIKEFAANFDNLTDEKTDEIWNLVLDFKSESVKLERQYYKKFKKVLPMGKVAKYFQAENKIEALITANLAIEIPMIDQK
jgi:hypothetical protein